MTARPSPPATSRPSSRRTTSAGVVPDQLDAEVAHALGAAFVRVVGAAGGAIVVGHDMRPSSPELVGGVRRGRDRRRAPTSSTIGLASTDELYFASGSLDLPGAMFTASHNPASYNGIKLCRGRRPADRAGHRPGRDPRPGPARACPAHDGAPGTVTAQDVLPGVRRVPAQPGRPLRQPPAEGRGRRRQRHGRAHGPDRARRAAASTWCRCTSSWTAPSPTTRRTRWTRPTSSTCRRGCVAEGADIGLAFDGDADRCFVVDERGDPVSPSAITALVAVRELAKHPGVDGDPQPDHLARGPRDRRRARRYAGADPGRALVHQGRDGPHRRGLRRRALGALLLPRLLAGRHRHARRAARAGGAGRAGPSRCPSWPRRTSATSPPARSTARWPTRRRPPRRSGTAFADPRRCRAGRARRADRRAGPDWWFNLRASNTEPLLRLNVEAADRPTMEQLRDEVLAMVRGGRRRDRRTKET